MSRTDVEINIKGLEQLLKAVTKPVPSIRVGILGASPRSEGKGPKQTTNATVGAAHEFGTTKLPQRSFLRVPLTDELQKSLERSGAFTKAALAEVVATGSLAPWIQKAGIVAEGVVLGAFDTSGYGKWKPSDMTKKENHQTLVETQQLRNSITHEVK